MTSRTNGRVSNPGDFLFDIVEWIISICSRLSLLLFPTKVSSIMEGSLELNRMRDEIRELPLILSGLIREEVKRRFSNYRYSDYPLWESENYLWQLDLSKGELVGVTLKYRERVHFHYYFHDKQITLDHSMIIEVHSRLPGLIAGMQRHFSCMSFALSPILKASKISKRRQ